MQNKAENLNVGKLFESEAFSKYAPLFLTKPTTILDVSRESKVSRQTISDQISLIPEYIEEPPWSPKVKGHPLRLKTQILTSYFSEKLGLDKFQNELLNTLLSNQAIQNIILKNNRDLGAVLSKTMLTILLLENINALSPQIQEYDIPLDFIGEIFSSVLNKQPLPSVRRKREYEKSEFGQTKEELQSFKSALVELSKNTGINQLTKKFRDSNFELKATPKVWSLLAQLAIKGELFDQIENSKAKARVLNWRRHPKTKEGKLIKKLSNQIGKGI